MNFTAFLFATWILVIDGHPLEKLTYTSEESCTKAGNYMVEKGIKDRNSDWIGAWDFNCVPSENSLSELR